MTNFLISFLGMFGKFIHIQKMGFDCSTLVLLACTLLLAAGCERSVKPTRMDVIFITIDTLRADHLGAYGYNFVETPVIDRLAREGVVFEQARAVTPLTLPSHTSIFTGLYTPSHGVRDNGDYRADERLLTLAEILWGNGYATGAVVGAVVLAREFGLSQGFDHYDDEGLRERKLEKRLVSVFPERSASEVTDKAIEWLRTICGESDKSKPNFFLWVHYFDPHFGYSPPPPFAQRYAEHPYDGEIAYTDEQIGRLLDEAHKLRGDKNLLVVLTADHGEGLGEHGELSHGGFLYDSTMHVPLIFHAPGSVKPRRVKWRVSSVDIVPTMLELLGIRTSQNFQGKSLVEMMKGKGADRDYYMDSAYVKFHFGWSFLRALGSKGFTVIEAPQIEVYDWATDKRQENNLAQQKKELANSYIKRLRVLVREMHNPVFADSAKAKMSEEMKAQLEALGYIWHADGELGNPGEEQFDLEAVSGINPADRKTFMSDLAKATSAVMMNNYEEAVELYKKLIRDTPESPQLLYRLALLYKSMGEFDSAVESLEKSLALNPSYHHSLLELGNIELLRGDLRKAERFYLKVLELYPSDVQAIVALGSLETRRGNWESAKKLFEQAVQISPGKIEAMMGLGEYFFRRGDYQSAVKQFEKVSHYNPDDAAVWSMLGKAKFELNDRAGAVEAYKKAMELLPNSVPDLFNYALILETGNNKLLLGKGSDPKNALVYYRKVLELDPDNVKARERIKAIKAYLGED